MWARWLSLPPSLMIVIIMKPWGGRSFCGRPVDRVDIVIVDKQPMSDAGCRLGQKRACKPTTVDGPNLLPELFFCCRVLLSPMLTLKGGAASPCDLWQANQKTKGGGHRKWGLPATTNLAPDLRFVLFIFKKKKKGRLCLLRGAVRASLAGARDLRLPVCISRGSFFSLDLAPDWPLGLRPNQTCAVHPKRGSRVVSPCANRPPVSCKDRGVEWKKRTRGASAAVVCPTRVVAGCCNRRGSVAAMPRRRPSLKPHRAQLAQAPFCGRCL